MMDSSHSISPTQKNALHEAAVTLSASGIEQPRLEAELLLAHVLDASKEDLILHPGRELTDAQEKQFEQFLQRRCRREPIAYILGQREFWSLEFIVNPKVLIPRPETEGIIEQLLKMAGPGGRDHAIHILDAGTGSGNLAVVAAVEFPMARVTAVDCSADALAVARENARKHRVADRIEFLQRNMMLPWNLPNTGGFDFILSNPPYLSSQEMARLMPDVRDYEPSAALDGSPDGLVCYRRIVPEACNHLKPGGGLILEVGDDQAGSVKKIIQAHDGYYEIEIVQDLSGRGRVVSARRALG